jgi:hypothetical protein
MIVIGSTAIKYWMPSFPRDPSDKDCVVLEGTPKIDGWDCHEVPIRIYNVLLKHSRGGMLTPFGWYMLKCSHLPYTNHNWVKHAKDVIWFQDERPDSTYVEMSDWQELGAFWHDYHKSNKDKIKLNKPVDDFFNLNVSRIYKHDDVHEAVKYDSVPAWKKISKNDGTASVSFQKWSSLSQREMLESGFEETYVLAIERYLLTGKVKDVKIAYRLAMQDLLTRMTTGWWNKWYIENLNKLFTPELDYKALFEINKPNKLEMII